MQSVLQNAHYNPKKSAQNTKIVEKCPMSGRISCVFALGQNQQIIQFAPKKQA